ncbi:MAG: DUF1178 family protein [Asticcacaulis sp.]
MIRYALKCDVGHEFEAWFSSSGGFDEQVSRGLVECPMCGTQAVSKAIMAPMVRSSKKAASAMDAVAEGRKAVAEALYRLRQHVESTHDYVGNDFASEARDIHQGMAPDRPIYGEATPEEVRGLVEGGVPVAAIPVFTPQVAPESDTGPRTLAPKAPAPAKKLQS